MESNILIISIMAWNEFWSEIVVLINVIVYIGLYQWVRQTHFQQPNVVYGVINQVQKWMQEKDCLNISR